MLLQTTHQRKTRAGGITVLVAIMLTALVGMIGIAIDGGAIMSEKRHAQTTADAAAMAGACILYKYAPTSYTNYTPSNTIQTEATTEATNIAAANGYTNTGNINTKVAGTSIVAVNFPPNITNSSIYNNTTNSPTYSGRLRDGCVEVVVTYFQQRYFSQIWGDNTLTITARAVAKGAWVPLKDGVLVLDYDPDKGSLFDTGNGSLSVTGGDIVVNSSHATAAVEVNGNASINLDNDKYLYATGGVSTSGTGITPSGHYLTGVHPTPDPLAYLPIPTQPADVAKATITGSAMGNHYYFPPGRYTSSTLQGVNLNNKTVHLNGGLYWFDTDFGWNNAAVVSDAGVLIYQKSGRFNVQGSNSSSITLSPQTSGTYRGITFWQASSNTGSSNEPSVSGNGGVNITGTLYAPTTTMNITGNGATINSGSQYVVNHLKVAGNGASAIAWSGDTAAPVRVLCLVE